ncbi:MAG: peptidoglycan-binding protein [Eubacteriales bacterium]|nr:peptidoglycan-binding protein [Eubacteriales bacterium]
MTDRKLFRQGAAILLLAALLCAVLPAGASSSTTLEFGSKGTEVLNLQKALVTLGYDPNGTDGKFGRGTEAAVKLYQQTMGLTADGKAGTLTLNRIYADLATISSGTTNSTTTDATTDTTTAYNPNTIKYGDSGTRVTELQTALKKLGYDPNGIDGRFGAGTKLAVINFQKANNLTADGLAGTQTQNLLYSLANASTGSGSSGTTDSSGSTGSTTGGTVYTRTLRKGYTGADVTAVQTRLKELGYYTSTIDGVYGTGSIAAVKLFQQTNGLSADGLAGSRTFSTLFSSSALAAGSSSSSGSTSGSTSDSGSGSGTTTDNGGSSSSGSTSTDSTYVTLSYGSTGSDVKRLQQALKNLNYNVGVDGDYGALTQTAVAAFQKQNGLTSDGVAGAKTQEVLYSGSANAADPNANSDMTIPDGTGTASGPSVSEVKLLHWYNDVKPSLSTGNKLIVFDPATNLQWTLRVYARGRHCDSEPLTLTDTQIMYKAFGNTNTWTPKPVYVQLPSGVWTLASTHNVPHLSGSITDNGFDGHLCVHFLRDMDECTQNDPNYGVTNQKTIRTKWKQMTGITVE